MYFAWKKHVFVKIQWFFDIFFRARLLLRWSQIFFCNSYISNHWKVQPCLYLDEHIIIMLTPKSMYIYMCAAHWAAATTNKKTVQIFAHFRLDGLNRLAFYGFSFMVSQLHGVLVSLRTCKDVVWKNRLSCKSNVPVRLNEPLLQPHQQISNTLKDLKCLSSLLHSPAAHWAAQQSTEITVSLTMNFENQKGHHKWHSWSQKVDIILIHIHPHL